MRTRMRRVGAGGFTGYPLMRLGSMVVLLVVIGMMYTRARDPQTWRWLADERDSSSHAALAVDGESRRPTRSNEPEEFVIPGPTGEDPVEWDNAQKLLDVVSDKMPLVGVEMPAYWRLMRWARAESFANLESRAERKVLYTQLWQFPEKYRGKPIRLRLNIRRVLEYDAPENSADVKRTYEAWGWTEESKSYPYVIVFSELPDGMKIGDGLREEGEFVGYFLKLMTYPDALDKLRAAPLLVGRLRRVESVGGARPVVAANDWFWIWPIAGAIVVAAAVGVWLRFARVKMPAMASVSATHEEEIGEWLRGAAAEPTSPAPASDDGKITE